MDFLLKTPVEETKMSALWEITLVDIFYSKMNEKFWYNWGKDRVETVNRASTYEKIEWKDVEIQMNILFRIKWNIPVLSSNNYEKDWRKDVTHSAIDYVNTETRKNVMSHSMGSRFMEFIKSYKIVSKSNVYAFVESDEESYNYSMGMLYMKEILMGNFLYTWFDVDVFKRTRQWMEQVDTQNMPIHVNLWMDNQMLYTYNWRQLSTPMYWFYTEALWRQSFNEFPRLASGKMFQRMQYKMQFESGESNYYIASGWSGKSSFLLWMAKNYILGERTTPWELSDGKVCHYYGLTHAGNTASINKISNMVNNMFVSDEIKLKNEILRRVKENNMTYLRSYRWKNNIHWQVEFLSGKGSESGRWGRPSLIIVDEFLKHDKENRDLVGRQIGQILTQKFFISTMNEDSRANEYYHDMLDAERAYNNVKRPMHDIVYDLWTGIWLDKCTSVDQFKTKIPDILEARRILIKERPSVGIRFDIRDIEHLTEEDKQYKIQVALKAMWPAFVMHEHFSILPNEVTEFPTKWLIEEVMPSQYDYVILFLDLGWVFDRPSLTWLWVIWDTMYIYRSHSVSDDHILQKTEVLEAIREDKNLLNSTKSRVYRWIDASGNARFDVRDSWQLRGMFPDYFVYNTPWQDGDPHIDKDWFLMVGKKPMVKIGQEYFKSRRVRISNKCTGDDSLVTQLGLFQKNGSTIKAKKGKDDKVTSMLGAIIISHLEWVKLKSATIDGEEIKRKWISQIDKIDIKEQEKKRQEQNKQNERLIEQLMYANR